MMNSSTLSKAKAPEVWKGICKLCCNATNLLLPEKVGSLPECSIQALANWVCIYRGPNEEESIINFPPQYSRQWQTITRWMPCSVKLGSQMPSVSGSQTSARLKDLAAPLGSWLRSGDSEVVFWVMASPQRFLGTLSLWGSSWRLDPLKLPLNSPKDLKKK